MAELADSSRNWEARFLEDHIYDTEIMTGVMEEGQGAKGAQVIQKGAGETRGGGGVWLQHWE